MPYPANAGPLGFPLFQTAADDSGHFLFVSFGREEEGHLVAGSHEIMFRVLDFVVRISVDVVGEEADGLHVREKTGGVGQVLYLDGGKEGTGRFQIPLRKGLENVHPEAHLFGGGIVLGHRVGGRTEEIPEVGEDEGRHEGIQVYDAEDIAVGVEHHVVHLGVAVTDALGKFPFAVQAFRLAHFFLKGKELLQDGLYFGLGHAAGGIGLDGFMELAGTEFHVVEIGDGFTQGVGNIGKHGFKIAEGLARKVRVLGIYGFVSISVFDEDGEAPITGSVRPVGLAGLLAREEPKDFAVDVRVPGKFPADMGRGTVYIVLKEFDVLKNSVVYLLKDIMVRSVRLYQEGVVDKSVSEGLDFQDIPLNVKMLYYGFHRLSVFAM